jgi:hypothetical protein
MDMQERSQNPPRATSWGSTPPGTKIINDLYENARLCESGIFSWCCFGGCLFSRFGLSDAGGHLGSLNVERGDRSGSKGRYNIVPEKL